MNGIWVRERMDNLVSRRSCKVSLWARGKQKVSACMWAAVGHALVYVSEESFWLLCGEEWIERPFQRQWKSSREKRSMSGIETRKKAAGNGQSLDIFWRQVSMTSWNAKWNVLCFLTWTWMEPFNLLTRALWCSSYLEQNSGNLWLTGRAWFGRDLFQMRAPGTSKTSVQKWKLKPMHLTQGAEDAHLMGWYLWTHLRF